MQDIKKFIKIAGPLQDALRKLRHSRYLAMTERFNRLQGKLREFTALSHRLDLATSRHWYAASEHCARNLSYLLSDLQYQAHRTEVFTADRVEPSPGLSALVEELAALEQEFGQVEFDEEPKAITVTTEPITLEGVYLGPFEIQLSIMGLGRIYDRKPYRIVALDPNPAAADENITHPHVSGEVLCEGDASAAIGAALEQGRLLDFFTLVQGVLNTYNQASPYVPLADWNGTACYDCGQVVDREDLYCCGSCENDVCEHCSTWCRECDETVCLSCIRQCAVCEDSFCRRCLRDCPQCGMSVCSQCMKDGICNPCAEEKDSDDEDSPTPSPEGHTQPQTEVRLAG